MIRFLLLVNILIFVPTWAAANSLVCFLPTGVKARKLTQTLKDEQELQKYDPIAYQRRRDFDMAVKSFPSLIIAPSSSSNEKYESIGQFLKKNETGFKYFLMRANGNPEIPFKKAKVGYIEEIPRKASKAYINNIFGGISFRGYKSVSNSNDLLALLSLGNVDYIIVSPSALEAAREEFGLKLETVQSSSVVFFPRLFLNRNSKLDKEVLIEKISVSAHLLGYNKLLLRGGKVK